MRFGRRAMSGPVFIAQRMEMVRIGDATPININLSTGEVLRFVCTAFRACTDSSNVRLA